MKYTFPKLKESKDNEPCAVGCDSEYPGEWDRTLRLPMNAEMIKALEVGQKVKLIITGDVSGLETSVRAEGQHQRQEATVVMSAITIPESNEFEDLIED